MNSARLKSLIKNQNTNISFEEYRVRYATERFLARIQESNYKDKLILKGGFLLGTIFKVDQRTTKDLDTLIREMNANRESVQTMIQNIIDVDLQDGVEFNLLQLIDSQQERIYMGFKAKLEMKFLSEKTVIKFDLDLGVGDTITPEAQRIDIPLLFNEKKDEKETITLLAYPLETILAEKTEIILDLGTKNSRMKDFYDIHLILNDPRLPHIDKLYEAFKNTWNFRHTLLNIDDEKFEDWYFIIEEISNDKDMAGKMWSNYIKDREYAHGLNFKLIVKKFKNHLKNLHVVYKKTAPKT